MATVAERVNKGVALLDEKLPGWREKINKDTLCLHSLYNCVLGQLYGSFDKGYVELFGSPSDYGSNGAAHGFDIYAVGLWQDHQPLFTDLTNEWKKRL